MGGERGRGGRGGGLTCVENGRWYWHGLGSNLAVLATMVCIRGIKGRGGALTFWLCNSR